MKQLPPGYKNLQFWQTENTVKIEKNYAKKIVLFSVKEIEWKKKNLLNVQKAWAMFSSPFSPAPRIARHCILQCVIAMQHVDVKESLSFVKPPSSIGEINSPYMCAITRCKILFIHIIQALYKVGGLSVFRTSDVFLLSWK